MLHKERTGVFFQVLEIRAVFSGSILVSVGARIWIDGWVARSAMRSD